MMTNCLSVALPSILGDEHTFEELKCFILEELYCIAAFRYATLWSWAFLVLGIALAVFIFHSKKCRRGIIRHLFYCALFVFGTGFIVYLVGFCGEGTAHNPLALCLRSIIASMEMFLSESELIEVVPVMKENPYYMMVFSAVHFLAVCISAAFILHIIGIRFRSFIWMRLAFKKERDVFVFFDLSPESMNLAKDIYKHYTAKRQHSKDDVSSGEDCQNKNKDSKDFQIVFVKTPMEENHLERFSFSHLLNFVDNRNETMEELREMGAFLTYSRKSVTIGIEQGKWHDTVGLNSLRCYLDKCTGDKHMFCLSSNEDNNISTAIELSKRYQNYQVYCRASHNCITESLASLNLTFIDSASLSVLELKKNVEYQPVSFINPNTRIGVATKPFRSLIIGFGETGLEVLKFLYEFGSFVGEDGKENPFYCDIIDPKAKQLRDSLYLHCPALDVSDPNDAGDSHAKPNCTITFHEGSIETNRNQMKTLIKEVDYIVICTNDDKENLALGITVLNLAYKYRKTSANFGIFIGIKDNNEFKKAEKIATYYNTSGKIDSASKYSYHFTITPFGSHKTIFTYDNVINNMVLDKAKYFFHEYQKACGDMTHADEHYQNDWSDREEQKLRHSSNDRLSLKNELAQKEFQDMANVWHIHTKLSLCGAYECASFSKSENEMAIARRTKLFDCISTVMRKLFAKQDTPDSYSFIQNQIAEYEQSHDIEDIEYAELLGNLAKCEHLRWDASNRMLGYRTPEHAMGNQKNYLSKTLACMVPNEQLTENEKLKDTIKYDYTTVMVSLGTDKYDKLSSGMA